MGYGIDDIRIEALLPALGRADVGFTSRFQLKR
jgi:hypothetical protein